MRHETVREEERRREEEKKREKRKRESDMNMKHKHNKIRSDWDGRAFSSIMIRNRGM